MEKISIAMTGKSISRGTLRTSDLINSFVPFLFKIDAERAEAINDKYPANRFAMLDYYAGQENAWYESEEANYMLEDLFDILNEYAPDGYYFGASEGDGSDFAYWPDIDPDDFIYPADFARFCD